MPEQLTKHPAVTLQVLRSAGATCGERATQEILTRCPAERFCKLPGGELCVYGLPDAPLMTQISAADWKGLASLTQPAPPEPAAVALTPLAVTAALSLVIGAAAGVAIGRRRR